jgi:6-pyruvoyl tetrahydropterin synthase/QueD family protein
MEVSVTQTLQMAHRLWSVKSKCQHLHGHTWTVTLTIIGEKQGDMLVDFFEVKRRWCASLDESFDHKLVLAYTDPLLLNLTPVEQQDRYPGLVVVGFVPTVENLAEMWIGYAKALFSSKYKFRILVHEGDKNSACTSLE